MNDNQHRSGFTILELTITVLIGSLIVSLAVPAVQQGRAKSRMTECKNNLKVIGIAMHNYHDVFNQFPPAWIGVKQKEMKEGTIPGNSSGEIGKNKPAKNMVIGGAVPQVDGGNHVTWQYFLLPFLEQGNLYDQMRAGIDSNQPDKYLSHLKTPVNAYMCPDDTSDQTFEVKNDKGVVFQVSRSNYGVNFGGKYSDLIQEQRKTAQTLTDCEPEKIPGQQCLSNGIAEHNGNMHISEITDGTTNTIMVAERVSFKTKNSQGQVQDYNLFWGYYIPDTKVAPGRFMFESIGPPNSGDNYGRYGSVHTGGAQVCFSNGAVRFVDDQVDASLMQSFGTRNGNENVSVDDVFSR